MAQTGGQQHIQLHIGFGAKSNHLFYDKMNKILPEGTRKPKGNKNKKVPLPITECAIRPKIPNTKEKHRGEREREILGSVQMPQTWCMQNMFTNQIKMNCFVIIFKGGMVFVFWQCTHNEMLFMLCIWSSQTIYYIKWDAINITSWITNSCYLNKLECHFECFVMKNLLLISFHYLRFHLSSFTCIWSMNINQEDSYWLH